jgi:hypothetical protein
MPRRPVRWRSQKGEAMPHVTIATGFTAEDGREEILTDYLCDVPDCPNPACQVMGFAREAGGGFAVCAEHAPVRRPDGSGNRQR